MSMPAKLNAMEAAVLQQKTELRQLQATYKSAIEARDSTKRELSKVEMEAYDSRKKREVELNITRKEVERRKTEAEKVERRHARATLVQDNNDLKVQQEKQAKLGRQQKVLTYDKAYRQIKEATHVTDMNEVVERVMGQQSKQDQLMKQVGNLDGQRQKLKGEYKRLLQQFHDMKYSGEQKESHSQGILANINMKLDYEKNQRGQHLIEKLNLSGSTLTSVMGGITTILNKLDEVKLRPPEHNFTRGNVFEELDLCGKKLDKLLQELNLEPESTAEEEFKVKLESIEFHDFLESQLSDDNVRIKLIKNDSRLSTLSEFDFDGQEHEQAFNRTDIKNLGNKLIESKTKRKKSKK